MKSILLYLTVVLCCWFATSCKEKKQETNIIATKPKIVKKNTPLSMSNYKQSMQFQWLGNQYNVEVERSANRELPLTDDGLGNKYYDNEIKLRIIRKDNTEFFNRIFTKADFSQYVDESYCKHGALLGIVFDKVEGNDVYFAVSVGSPDSMSDEYVPLVMKISKLGSVTIKKDTQLDTNNIEETGGSTPDEDGV